MQYLYDQLRNFNLYKSNIVFILLVQLLKKNVFVQTDSKVNCIVAVCAILFTLKGSGDEGALGHGVLGYPILANHIVPNTTVSPLTALLHTMSCTLVSPILRWLWFVMKCCLLPL